MHILSNYEIFIFDCDGVILDSNQLKIEAMNKALFQYFGEHKKIQECLNYFTRNFGASRFHHVDVFVNDIFCLSELEKKEAYKKVIEEYSTQCKRLYLTAKITPGFIEFIEQLPGDKYVASGSEQNELVDVFKSRGLDVYFEKILGSPEKKKNLVASIVKAKSSNAIMFGDAISDMDAALENSIDFVAYLPYSNVREELVAESMKRGFITMNKWSFEQ